MGGRDSRRALIGAVAALFVLAVAIFGGLSQQPAVAQVEEPLLSAAGTGATVPAEPSAGGSYSVTYTDCSEGDTITFTQLQSTPSTVTDACVAGNATATFTTAPTAPGTYTGTAVGLPGGSPETTFTFTIADTGTTTTVVQETSTTQPPTTLPPTTLPTAEGPPPPSPATTTTAPVLPAMPTSLPRTDGPPEEGAAVPTTTSRPVGRDAVPNSNILPSRDSPEFPDSVEAALVDAELKSTFDPDPLVELQRADLFITFDVVSNGDGDDVTPQDFPGRDQVVQIARENVVTIESETCDATSLETALEEDCDFYVSEYEDIVAFGEPAEFKVTPLKAGVPLSLTVRVKPTLEGDTGEDFRVRNPDITVTATANPRRQDHESLEQRAADALTVSVDDAIWREGKNQEIDLGETADILVKLSVPDDVEDPDIVTIDNLMVDTEDAEAGLAKTSEVDRQDREFTQSWSVTPGKAGSYTLSFGVDGEVQLSEEVKPLECCGEVLTQRTLVVSEPGKSLISRADDATQSWATRIIMFTSAGGAVYGLVKRRRSANAV